VDAGEEEQSSSEAAASEPHAVHVVVWDVPTVVDACATFRFKVGVGCALGCRARDCAVEIRGADGRTLASGALNDTPWPGTGALYFAELTADAPAEDGLHGWQALVSAIAAQGDDVGHAAASAEFNVRVVPAAQCRLEVIAIDARSRVPVEGARVVAHPYRASTREDGVAELRVPKGEYRVFVSGRSYLPFRADSRVEADTTIRVELVADAGVSDAELWG
jgi:hypothetical protein